MPETVRVLVVEDDEADRFFLRRMLKRCAPGSSVVEFAYAEEALTYLRSAGRPVFDIIFVDINMPRMDGFAFADAYDRLYPELKGGARLWIMSHSIDPRDRARAEGHPGIAGFMSKSSGPDDLAAVLSSAERARAEG
ncbi:response regulator [Rhodobacterales bacterium HKCCE2091]|nr:response regulator [Rhodobacterales bacterium HKCCE2091]